MQGAAQGDAEFAVLGGVHPADRAGVPAAVHLLQLGDRRGGGGPGLTSDRWSRVQQAGQRDRRARLGQLGEDRRRQMLDVCDLDDLRFRRRLDPHRMRAQGADDPRGDDALLAAVLVAAQQLLAEVVVDGRVGAAPGRAGEGNGGDAGAGAANQQLRAGAEEGGLRSAAAEAEAVGNCSRIEPKTAAGSCAEAPATTTSRASTTLLISPAPIRSVAAATERSKSPRGPGAANLRARRQVRVEQRQWAAAQTGQSSLQRGALLSRVVARPRIALSVRNVSSPLRQSDSSGRTIEPGESEDQLEEAPPVWSKANPPSQTTPAPAGSRLGSSSDRIPPRPQALLGYVGEAFVPARGGLMGDPKAR